MRTHNKMGLRMKLYFLVCDQAKKSPWDFKPSEIPATFKWLSENRGFSKFKKRLEYDKKGREKLNSILKEIENYGEAA